MNREYNRRRLGVENRVICGLRRNHGCSLFLFFQGSAAERLSSSLSELLEEDGVVELQDCNVSIVVNKLGEVGAPIALTRIVIQADMRNYDFETVRIIPSASGASLRIDRGPVDDLMLSNLSKIIEAGGARVAHLVPDEETARKLLEADDSTLYFRVMAEVVETASGTTELVAHEDAPDFFGFVAAIEITGAPISYRSTTTFAASAPSAETLLTGEVVAIPFLQFAVASEGKAKELAHAFNDYAVDKACS